VLQQHIHNYLRLSDNPLNIKDLAEAKCLPPALHIKNITLLFHPDSSNLQKIMEGILKVKIENDIIHPLSIDEFLNTIKKWENTREPQGFKKLTDPGKLPTLTSTAIGYGSKDLVIHKDEMKRWLEYEGDWPLSENNLLSRWWTNNYKDNPDTPKRIIKREDKSWRIYFDGDNARLDTPMAVKYISVALNNPRKEFTYSHIVENVQGTNQTHVVDKNYNNMAKKKGDKQSRLEKEEGQFAKTKDDMNSTAKHSKEEAVKFFRKVQAKYLYSSDQKEVVKLIDY
jgi:hypothetical protein